MTLDAMQSFGYGVTAVLIAAAIAGLCSGVKALAWHILKKKAEKQQQERKRER